MTDVGVVSHQVLTIPTKLDVGVFTLTVGEASSLDRRFLQLLFHVMDGRFHKTHSIHHPIQVFDVVNDGFSSSLFAAFLQITSSSWHNERTKTVNSNEGKGWFSRRCIIQRHISHFLFSWGGGELAFFWSENNYLRLFSQLLFLEVSKPFRTKDRTCSRPDCPDYKW